MKTMLKNGFMACAVAALAIQGFAGESETEAEWPAGAPDPKSYGYTALMLGLATPFSLPWDFNWDVFGMAVNVGYTDANLMYGLELAAGANTARNTMMGLQASASPHLSRELSVKTDCDSFSHVYRAFFNYIYISLFKLYSRMSSLAS